MRRTRNQKFNNHSGSESEEDVIIKKTTKRANKRSSCNNPTNNINIDDTSSSNKNKEKAENKHSGTKFENIFSKEFLTYIDKIQHNLKSFEMKPEYIDKNYDISLESIHKMQKLTKFKSISPIEIYYKMKYEEFHKMSLEVDKCSICLFEFYDENLKDLKFQEINDLNEKKKNEYDVILLKDCSDHFFHLDCFLNLIGDKESTKCPNCNRIYGILTGNQPKGSMKVDLEQYPCAGYEDVDTILISYKFPNGKGYTGTTRNAFLPNNKEGRELLALFKVAFDRKLTFTVGTSVTTGQENTTIWNGIHHKTNTSGGSHNFGYPDATYFNRVKQELAAKGVVEENIEDRLEDIANELIPALEKKKVKKSKKK